MNTNLWHQLQFVIAVCSFVLLIRSYCVISSLKTYWPVNRTAVSTDLHLRLDNESLNNTTPDHLNNLSEESYVLQPEEHFHINNASKEGILKHVNLTKKQNKDLIQNEFTRSRPKLPQYSQNTNNTPTKDIQHANFTSENEAMPFNITAIRTEQHAEPRFFYYGVGVIFNAFISYFKLLVKTFLPLYKSYKTEADLALCYTTYLSAKMEPLVQKQKSAEVKMAPPKEKQKEKEKDIMTLLVEMNQSLSKTQKLLSKVLTNSTNSSTITTKPERATNLSSSSVQLMGTKNVMRMPVPKPRIYSIYQYIRGKRSLTSVEEKILERTVKILNSIPGMSYLFDMWTWFSKLNKHQLFTCTRRFVAKKFWNWIEADRSKFVNSFIHGAALW